MWDGPAPARIAVIAGLLALASSWTVAAQRSSLPEIAKGSDVVFGRALEAGTTTPVAGAIVTITGYLGPPGAPPPGTFARFGSNVSASRGVITNADGYFLFRDLAARQSAGGAARFPRWAVATVAPS
jgi:hypothetical protein